MELKYSILKDFWAGTNVKHNHYDFYIHILPVGWTCLNKTNSSLFGVQFSTFNNLSYICNNPSGIIIRKVKKTNL